MADINPYLTAIMDAVYGEEVRGAIHDAIAAMNNESSTAMSAAVTAQNSAANSATTAGNYADSAAASSVAAASSADYAEQLKNDAAASAQAAITAKETAQNAATQAGNSATSAASSAASALSSKNTIDSKVAHIDTMESNLIEFHSIFTNLEDSNGDPILDSSDGNVLKSTIYADASDVINLQNSINSIIEYLNFLNAHFLLNRIENIEKSLAEQ